MNQIKYQPVTGKTRTEMYRNGTLIGVIQPDANGTVRSKLAAFVTFTAGEAHEYARKIDQMSREVRRRTGGGSWT